VSANPPSSAPSWFSAGTSASSKTSSQVSEARTPSFSSFLPVRKPGVSRSRTKAVRPFCFLSGEVDARTTKIEPTPPWVMKVFEPFRIQRSPFFTARVLAAPASEPEAGSVRAQAPSAWPVARRGT
jgi:hypothetical protein